jgi:hypothetical protein
LASDRSFFRRVEQGKPTLDLHFGSPFGSSFISLSSDLKSTYSFPALASLAPDDANPRWFPARVEPAICHKLISGRYQKIEF